MSNIIIKRGSEVIELDSRPSDAISTALKSMVPIYVTDDILKTIKSKNIISNQHFPEQITNRNNEKNYNTEEIIKAIPLKKLGSCSQVANLVSFLVSSNAGSYITGQTISIDGGMSI